MTTQRLSYEASCQLLQKDYLEPGEVPPIPDRVPRYDDDTLGVSFFRTVVGEGDDLSNLTLPRTFFGRSEVNNARFLNTDFTESCMCWNDFIDVDFSHAVLARCDMRASSFDGVKFVGADLRQADMRHADFENCDFSGAAMAGAVLTHAQGEHVSLSPAQRSEIAWTDDPGDEPDGG